MSAATWEEKFLSKCRPRSGRTKAVRPTVGSEANRPKAETQPTLFDNPASLSAEEIAYQKLLNELSERERNEVLRLTGGEWMQLDESFFVGE